MDLDIKITFLSYTLEIHTGNVKINLILTKKYRLYCSKNVHWQRLKNKLEVAKQY